MCFFPLLWHIGFSVWFIFSALLHFRISHRSTQTKELTLVQAEHDNDPRISYVVNAGMNEFKYGRVLLLSAAWPLPASLPPSRMKAFLFSGVAHSVLARCWKRDSELPCITLFQSAATPTHCCLTHTGPTRTALVLSVFDATQPQIKCMYIKRWNFIFWICLISSRKHTSQSSSLHHYYGLS